MFKYHKRRRKKKPALTVNSKVAQRRTGSPLHFGVMAAEQEEDRIEGVAADGAHFLLSDLRERERSAPLKINIIREREGRERRQR